jgi:hypothetical protein
MGLITKPPSWGFTATSLTGTPGTTIGTVVTANANDADGTAVALISALSRDVEFLSVGAGAFAAATGNGSTLLDILVDPAGGTSWSVLISDLLVGWTSTPGVAAGQSVDYMFPLWVPAGSAIGARARTAHTSNISGRVTVNVFGDSPHPASWWCGQRVETIGVDDTISQGTNHTPGNSGAFSNWANFGSTLSADCGAIQFGVHGANTDTTSQTAAYHFQFGVGTAANTNVKQIGPTIHRTTNTSEAGAMSNNDVIFCALPSGTQLQTRGTCSTTAEVIDVAAYAVI